MAITVAIAGITGKFGRLVATHLLKNPDVTLRGLCRDTSKVISSIASNPKVQLFQGDAYDHDKIRAFVGSSDVVICFLPRRRQTDGRWTKSAHRRM